MEETRCDEDREMKLGCPQLGKVARFSVAFESIIAHKDRLDCTVVAGRMGTFLGVSPPSCPLRAKGFRKLHLPLLLTEWLFWEQVSSRIPGCSKPIQAAGIAAATCPVSLTCQSPRCFALPEQGPPSKTNLK